MLSRTVGPSYRSLSQLGAGGLRLPACRPPGSRHSVSEKQFSQHRQLSQAEGSSMGASATPVKDSIHKKVSGLLSPISFELKDESSQHAGHAAMKGLPAGETHFKLSIISPDFEGLTTIKRHRLVYKVLAEELAGPVHALSLKTKAPSESR